MSIVLSRSWSFLHHRRRRLMYSACSPSIDVRVVHLWWYLPDTVHARRAVSSVNGLSGCLSRFGLDSPAFRRNVGKATETLEDA